MNTLYSISTSDADIAGEWLAELEILPLEAATLPDDAFLLCEGSHSSAVRSLAERLQAPPERLIAISPEASQLPAGCLWLTPHSLLASSTVELVRVFVGSSEAQHSQALLAQISHDMRSPLSVISTAASLAKRIVKELPKAQRYLNLIEESTGSLKSLVNDILDFSKMRAGELAFVNSEFQLHQLAHSTVEGFSLLAKEKGRVAVSCRIDSAVPPAVLGDPGRLRQILTNLLSNAMKFTEHGEISLTVRPSPDTADRLEFQVRDTGIGIRPEVQEKIFAPYRQADDTVQTTHGGTGLGLTICRLLAAKMDGRIWVESVYGQGSTFAFTARLPAVERVGEERLPILTGRSLLIVHRNPKIFTERLERELRIVLASDLEKPLSASPETSDLYLVDLEVSGFELPQRILQQYPEAKVVVTTSAGQRGEVAHCRQLGIAGYLTTPIEDLELNTALALALRSDDVATKYTAREYLAARGASAAP